MQPQHQCTMIHHPEHSMVRGCFDMVRLEVDTIDDHKDDGGDDKEGSDTLRSRSANTRS